MLSNGKGFIMKRIAFVLFALILSAASLSAFGAEESFAIDYPEVNTSGSDFLSAYVDEDELPIELFTDMFDDLSWPASKVIMAFFDSETDIDKLLTQEEQDTFSAQIEQEEGDTRIVTISYNGYVLDEDTGYTFWGDAVMEQRIGRGSPETVSFKGVLKLADDCIFEVEASHDPDYYNPIVVVNGEQLDVGENPMFFVPGKGVDISSLFSSVGPQKFTSFN